MKFAKLWDGELKASDFVYLWTVYYKNEDWCCYVIAPTRGRAKYLFQDYWKEGEFTDIRLNKIKEANGYREGVYDMDCDVLRELGVRYLTEEEWEEQYSEY